MYGLSALFGKIEREKKDERRENAEEAYFGVNVNTQHTHRELYVRLSTYALFYNIAHNIA